MTEDPIDAFSESAVNYCISPAQPGGELWRHVEQHSPQTVRYMADTADGGDYRCFVAIDAHGGFAGLCIVAIGRLGFGPLANQTVACLENILVPERYRRKGIGSALLQEALEAAWQSQATHVWWTVGYENLAAIAFYASRGALFIAEEDPAVDNPQRYYTVVAPNPAIASRKSVAKTPARRSGGQSFSTR